MVRGGVVCWRGQLMLLWAKRLLLIFSDATQIPPFIVSPTSNTPLPPTRTESDTSKQLTIPLVIELEISAEAMAEPPEDEREQNFDFAEEEVTKVEEKIDPFDLL